VAELMPKAPLVPQDAATLVLIDTTGPHPRILMGRRRADLAFMAGKYVFPGGRVDPEDAAATGYGALAPPTQSKLMARMVGIASPERAHGLAVAAVRELREETGLVFGSPETPPLPLLTFFARAITPPDRVRRYDTRFFLADAAHVSGQTGAGDGEFDQIVWVSLMDARNLDLARITRLIIDDVAAHLAGPPANCGPDAAGVVPFYYDENGHSLRELL
jgi:8-oxo-dGTP pyrophosphatase MutT (NUDIX family)